MGFLWQRKKKKNLMDFNYTRCPELKQQNIYGCTIIDDMSAELLGLRDVKNRLRHIAAWYTLETLRQKFSEGRTKTNKISGNKIGLHMVFTGLAGTGKTMVAEKMGALLYRLGATASQNVKIATREKLVGEFVGHTAPKTKAVLESSIGGVLIIEDAASLYKSEDSRDYAGETLEMLLQFMENHREDSVIILIGYPDEMESFLKSNPGLSSRIAHNIHFAGYSNSELLKLARMYARTQEYRMTRNAEYKLAKLIAAERSKNLNFGQARFVRNILESSKHKHAKRLLDGAAQKPITAGAVLTLDECDIASI